MAKPKNSTPEKQPDAYENHGGESVVARLEALDARVKALEAAARGDAPYRAPAVEPDHADKT